ncbi:MAG: cytochrome d ubiquinol oxidase subunit II, partial [Bacteroidales bacterium]
ILAILYFMNNIDNDAIFIRSRKHLWINTIPFLIAFLFFLTMLLVKDGFAVDPDSKMVSMEKYKYLHNLLEMPVILVMLLIGVAGVLFGIIRALIKKTTIGIWFTGPGTILTVLALFLIAGFNNTAFYPSTFDLQSSLTIENASSSKFTLTVMSYVSLLVPVVVAYIWYAWRSMNRKQITQEELSKEDHVY